MTRRVTRAEFIRLAQAPKPRFVSMAVTRDGQVRLEGRTAGPCVWFERHQEVVEESGAFTINPGRATVHMLVDARVSALFYLEGARLVSCTFAFDLSPHELEKAAKGMKAAGLGHLVAAAAAYTVENMPVARRAPVEAQLRALAASTSRRRALRPGTRAGR